MVLTDGERPVMFKSGVIVGKFYPFHTGHEYLIDVARFGCEELTVLVCTLPTEEIDGALRYRWVSEHYKDTNVRVIHVTDILPQHPEESSDFWEIWCNLVRHYVPNVDVVFSGEEYGWEFGKQLQVSSMVIDRNEIPISGTICRSDIYKNWKYLPPVVQRSYRKTICIVGAESSGKSTLAEALSNHYNVPWVPEYGREYCVGKDTFKLTDGDFISIADGQRYRDLWALEETDAPFIIVDTDAVITSIFYELYCKYGSLRYKDNVDTVLLLIANSHSHDFYLVTDNSVPWVNDGQRDFEQQRDFVFNKIVNNLVETKKCYTILENNRLEGAIEVINQWFNL